MLNKGASQEWHTQLKIFMGEGNGDMNATAILHYFSPLRDHLQAYITENNLKVGMKKKKKKNPNTTSHWLQARKYSDDEKSQVSC